MQMCVKVVWFALKYSVWVCSKVAPVKHDEISAADDDDDDDDDVDDVDDDDDDDDDADDLVDDDDDYDEYDEYDYEQKTIAAAATTTTTTKQHGTTSRWHLMTCTPIFPETRSRQPPASPLRAAWCPYAVFGGETQPWFEHIFWTFIG